MMMHLCHKTPWAKYCALFTLLGFLSSQVIIVSGFNTSIPINQVVTHQFTATIILEDTIAHYESDSRGDLTIISLFEDTESIQGVMVFRNSLEEGSLMYGLGDPTKNAMNFLLGVEFSHFQFYDDYSVKMVFLEISSYLSVADMEVRAIAFLSDQDLSIICSELSTIIENSVDNFILGVPLENTDSTTSDTTSPTGTDTNSSTDSTDDDTSLFPNIAAFSPSFLVIYSGLSFGIIIVFVLQKKKFIIQ